MSLLRFSIFSLFFLISCTDSKREKVVPLIDENNVETINEGSYSFDSNKAKIIWKGFKTTDRIQVTGQFEQFESSRDMKQFDSLEGLIDGLDFSISTSSSASGDPVRDLNLKDYFFKLLTSNFRLSGSLGYPNNNLIPVTFNTLLGSKTVELSYFFENSVVEIKGIIDIGIDLGGVIAYESIHQQCEQLHTGGDGVSKTWSEVEVLVRVPIIRN